MNTISQKTVANLIEYNTSKYFLNLGRLNNDEVCDTHKIKYIFTKNWQSRVFMANFNESCDANINQIISRIKELNINALWLVTPMSRPANLQNLLEDNGFTYQKDWRAMAIDLATVPERFNIPENVAIKEVLNLEGLEIWTDVLVKSFEFEEKMAESYKKYFINLGIESDLNCNYYLGIINGKPVASSILFKGEGAAGLFYIGTVRWARRKGIAKTMTYYLLNEARNKGYNISVLQASEMGYPLYKKIGFEEYYATSIYNWKKSF